MVNNLEVSASENQAVQDALTNDKLVQSRPGRPYELGESYPVRDIDQEAPPSTRWGSSRGGKGDYYETY